MRQTFLTECHKKQLKPTDNQCLGDRKAATKHLWTLTYNILLMQAFINSSVLLTPIAESVLTHTAAAWDT